MALLVHIVGVSDLGIDEPRGKVEGKEQRLVPGGSDSDICKLFNNLESARQGELREARKIRESAQVFARLWNADYRSDPQEITSPSTSGRQLPLPSALRAVAKRAGEPVDLLLLGSSFGQRPTTPLAELLADAWSACGDRVRETAGIDLRKCTVFDCQSLVEDEVVGRLAEQLRATAGPIYVAIGAGANTLLVILLRALQENGDRTVELLIPSQAPNEAAEAVSFSHDVDAYRGWTTALGLADLAAVADGALTELEQVTAAAFSEDASWEDRAEALRNIVLADIARGDIGAGLAVRAWVYAGYRARLAPGEKTAEEELQKETHLTLGHHIGWVSKQPEPTFAQQWLLRVKELNQVGKDATHRLMGADSREAQQTRDSVRHLIGGDLPTGLVWPTGDVAFVHAVGPSDKTEHENSVLVNLCNGVCPLDLGLTPGSAETYIHRILLASKDTATVAEQVRREQIAANGWRCDGDGEIIEYGTAFRDLKKADEITARMKVIEKRVYAALEQLEPRVQAVILDVPGEKHAFLAATRAAQRFGARFGLPVTLLSHVKGTGGELQHRTQLHYFVVSPRDREQLLRVAHDCLRRLDLLTVARILRVTGSEFQEVAKQAQELAERMRASLGTEDERAYILAALAGVVVDNENFADWSERDKGRVAVIVGELAAKYLKKSGQKRKKLLQQKSSFPAELKYLWALEEVRNLSPYSHGHSDFAASLQAACEKVGLAGCSYLELLCGAREFLGREHGEDVDWADTFRQLRDCLAGAAAATGTES
ncbi:hypothetical protein EII12_06030 [Buchananella hordeovulneris]|uniref:hypothetical protein n=1 Tax=Buchananella hordeovulneris TaxID=52770 RepID=UPI000F5E3ABA|nr:hypothetical protein [Buchananella hordeovulneris]RRD52101.1 hypothetical protein EII12_06030 [Buchananella hordeovulneris]